MSLVIFCSIVAGVTITAYVLGYKHGYCQAVTDMKENRPLLFKLSKKENGETKWKLNK